MSVSNDATSRARRLGAAGLALGSAWTLVAAFAVHPMLPDNPVRLPGDARGVARAILPEGWAFFTRDPREARMSAWGRGSDGWTRNTSWPHSSPGNLLGLRRASRTQGVELGLLQGEVSEGDWVACSGELQDCLGTAPVARRVHTAALRPTLCGDVAIVSQPPVPWAWARSARPARMPARVVRLEVTC